MRPVGRFHDRQVQPVQRATASGESTTTTWGAESVAGASRSCAKSKSSEAVH